MGSKSAPNPTNPQPPNSTSSVLVRSCCNSAKRLCLSCITYPLNISLIGAIIKKSSWGWGLGVKLYWSKINFGYAKILVLTRSNDTPSFSTIELILRKLSWGVGGWGGWGRTLSPEKDVPLQVVPIFQISAWSVIRQENWCYWGVGGLG